MTSAQKTITSVLEELSAETGISEADFDGKVKIEGKDLVIASRHHPEESTSVLPPLVEFTEFKLGPRGIGIELNENGRDETELETDTDPENDNDRNVGWRER